MKIPKVTENAEIWTVEDTSLLYITIKNDNIEKRNALLRLVQEHAIIQRYSWISIFDENHVEYIEPKVSDAYKFELVVSGTKQQLYNVLDAYNEYIIGIQKVKKMLM